MPAQVTTYLRALMCGACDDSYVEVRFRRPGGMGQLFFPVARLHDAARVIDGLGVRTDVYVGVAPRTVPAGDRSAVADSRVAWADCDGSLADERVQTFEPAPSLVVRSGSPGACHAYWMLARALPVPAIERLNRRLAAALAADAHAVDAARVLRPPGTRNFKHSPPTMVELARHLDERVDVRRLERALPDLTPLTVSKGSPRAGEPHDPLLAIAPAEYVRTLLGVEADRAHKVRCPFHDDRTPSLHVYDEPHRGWHCFGCGRGGSIYDFAANLWQLDTRGGDFLTLRKQLRRALGV
jgi:hypothetical protein